MSQMKANRKQRAKMAAFCLSVALAGPGGAQEQPQSFDCVMDPMQTAQIGAAVAGLLAEINVERGQRVTEGQVIARLESAVEEATVRLLTLRAQSQVAVNAQRARRDLIATQKDRISALAARNVASANQLEQVDAELIAAEAMLSQAQLDQHLAAVELERARAQLAQRRITSPFAGVVQARNKSVGEFVAANGSVISLAQLDPLRVEAFLPVDLYPALRLGMSARVIPDAPFDQAQNAKIISIDQIFDAASGTFAVRLELPNPGGRLPAGHRCRVRFDHGS